MKTEIELSLLAEEAERLGNIRLANQLDVLVEKMSLKRANIDLLSEPTEIIKELRQVGNREAYIELSGSTLRILWQE